MDIEGLRQKWIENAEAYKTAEVGGGVQDFVKDIFSHPEFFGLKLTPKKSGKHPTFVHDTEGGEHGRPDFVLYAHQDVTIPCEAKCFTRIQDPIVIDTRICNLTAGSCLERE
jgi:acetylornithine deacetylase/succinyl-diaminopimelate desuccinylase-like protein